jgi:hypothetical protein
VKGKEADDVDDDDDGNGSGGWLAGSMYVFRP